MRGVWLLCLCAFLLAQQPETLVINSFDTEGTWNPQSSNGCNIKVHVDRLNTMEGQASLRLEAQFTGVCEQQDCYGGITGNAPDLTGYAFLRLWTRAETSGNYIIGIFVTLADGGTGFHFVQVTTNWHLETISFSDGFEDKEQSISVAPEDIETISFFIVASKPVTARVNVDGLIALTDLNNNGVPDADERSIADAATNSEQVADDYFAEEDYEKAERYYEEAKNLYQQLGDEEKARDMDLKSKGSRAYKDYKTAEDLYQQEQYIKAMQEYEKARRGFVMAGNRDMIDLVEDRLEELSELTGQPVSPPPERLSEWTKEPPDQRQRGNLGGLLFVLMIVFLIGVGVYVWKFRKAPEPEKKEEKAAEPLLPSEKKAEEVRKLKAKFVYGEINRKEYEKRLRELEENS